MAKTTLTFYLLPLAEYPVDGWCDPCALPSLIRFVFEFTDNPAEAPRSLLTPVVCSECGLRYE